MLKFQIGKWYRLADPVGFVHHQYGNDDVLQEIKNIGGKIRVRKFGEHGDYNGNYEFYVEETYDSDHILDESEAQFFEEVPDDEVPYKVPNVSYVYTEEKVKKAIINAFEDDEFFESLRLLTAADAAHVMNLKIEGFVKQ